MNENGYTDNMHDRHHTRHRQYPHDLTVADKAPDHSVKAETIKNQYAYRRIYRTEQSIRFGILERYSREMTVEPEPESKKIRKHYRQKIKDHQEDRLDATISERVAAFLFHLISPPDLFSVKLS